MKKYILAMAIAAATASAGCVGFESGTKGTASTPAGPSGTVMSTLGGTWRSAAATAFPSPSSCTNFNWNVTENTGTSARGSFSATCPGDLAVTGTAQGTLSGSTITWSANGNATGPALSSCPIALTGTAELGVDSIRVPYSGDTCLGRVSGVEILTRR